MLLNFCDHRLRPEVHCSTVHTEGYEVSNLIKDTNKGFLAYSCIRPPVNIDFTFLCNVRIHYVLIWPSVGSQKSSGFQLYGKSTNDHSTPYTLLSCGNLGSNDIGLVFHSSRIDVKSIPSPTNFLKRYIPASKDRLVTYTNSLRLCIWKTENSVPALGRVEVWGTVSPNCGKDVMASVCALWTAISEPASLRSSPKVISQSTEAPKEVNNKDKTRIPLEVPENFLDAITYEIMTQPIILPSGKIVDQRTLEKYEESEAVWGRTASDPFTGLPFMEKRKPVIACALKTQIDKFLLENSNADEIKRLPRVLGRASENSRTCNSEIIGFPSSSHDKSTINTVVPSFESKTNILAKEYNSKTKYQSKESSLTKKVGRYHKLPIIAISSTQFSNSVVPIKRKKTGSTPAIVPEEKHEGSEPEKRCNKSNVEDNLNSAVQDVLSSLKCFQSPKRSGADQTPSTCDCCDNKVFYKLPCAHVVCRKALLSENYKCRTCGKSWKSSKVMRIHE